MLAEICCEPILEMLSVIPVVAPCVIDTRITTAMTPMMMPSIVRNERILLLMMAFEESLRIFPAI